MPFRVVLRLRVVVFLTRPLNRRIFAPHALAALEPFFNLKPQNVFEIRRRISHNNQK